MIVLQGGRLRLLCSYIGVPVLLLVLFDIGIAIAYVFGGWTWLAVPDVPLSIFGGIIGVIVSFRNASAYARWWEARTIWGAIVNNSRSFAREVLTMVVGREADESRRKLVLLQIEYVEALRDSLRGIPVRAVPLSVQQNIAAILRECYAEGWIDDIRWANLDRTLSTLMDSQGASERIKNTPMPQLYDLFIRIFIGIFCLLLPLGMVASLKLWTPIGSALVGFMFLALDKIGRDLETPFENTHGIALTAITRTIEINLKQMLGEADVPEPLVPVDGVLW
jgi:putative membrane protein